jgi:hypothetical protein
MVSDVQGWLNSPASNFGWMLKNEDEVDATTFRAFYSRDTVNTALHPALTITYAVPEPESVLLALLGAILAITGMKTVLRKKSAVFGRDSRQQRRYLRALDRHFLAVYSHK